MLFNVVQNILVYHPDLSTILGRCKLLTSNFVLLFIANYCTITSLVAHIPSLEPKHTVTTLGNSIAQTAILMCNKSRRQSFLVRLVKIRRLLQNYKLFIFCSLCSYIIQYKIKDQCDLFCLNSIFQCVFEFINC